MAASARTYRGTPRNLALLARLLRAGGLVAVPTETVYGLAGDATRAAACRRIFAAKGRPYSDPLIVHIASLRDLRRVALPNPAALKLARLFWPGPLTLVLPKTSAVPDEATAGLPSVAVRMPAHPLLRRLIRLAGVPLAAPSANPFGYVSPTTAEHVRKSMGSRIGHILDGWSPTGVNRGATASIGSRFRKGAETALWELRGDVLGGWSAIRKLAGFGRSPGPRYFASGATTPIFDVTRNLR